MAVPVRYRLNLILRSILSTICIFTSLAACSAYSSTEQDLVEAFANADKVDLSTSQVSSVVKLRETVGIPPPAATVLVKRFKRSELPAALEEYFSNPNIAGITINGRFVAVIDTPLKKQYEDVLAHELVHAYITLASPKPLPFWFQEGSAVHFSTDKARKFYGQPSETQRGVMVGQMTELPDEYKRKLHSFHFLIGKVGKDEFYKWYKEAVETGDVNPRSLLGLEQKSSPPVSTGKKPLPVWTGLVIGVTVIVVAIAGYIASKRQGDYI